jgi:sulfur carrier protein ThiS
MSAILILQKKEYPVNSGQSVGEAIHTLGLHPETYLALREGEIIPQNEILQDGDTVKLIAVISGGV